MPTRTERRAFCLQTACPFNVSPSTASQSHKMTASGGTSRDRNRVEGHDKTYTLYFLDQTWDLEWEEGKIALVVQERLKVFGAGLWQWLTSDHCRFNYAVKLLQRIRNDVTQQGRIREQFQPGAVAKYVSLLYYLATLEHLEKLPIPD